MSSGFPSQGQSSAKQSSQRKVDQPATESTLEKPLLPPIVQADLNQLYFDRVHPSMPMIHKVRHLSSQRPSSLQGPPSCLCYAMWAFASLLSGQYRDLKDSLYLGARRSLAESETRDLDVGLVNIELAQAWILISFYEFMHMFYHRGWMSAGRAIRLVQSMGLHQLDAVSFDESRGAKCPPDDWTRIEERRRTFWMAFVLDHFVSVRNEWPMAMNEQVICTRLPVSDEAFQRSQITQTLLLSEAIAAHESIDLSPFAGMVVIAAIIGRSLSNKQQCIVERTYGSTSEAFWQRHRWLDSLIDQLILSQPDLYQITPETTEPMVLCMNMATRGAIIYHHRISVSKMQGNDNGDSMRWREESTQKCLTAAREIAKLAQLLKHLSLFTIHPLTPFPLYLSATVLAAHRLHSATGSVDPSFRFPIDALHKLKSINCIASESLRQFESEFSGVWG